MFTSVADKADDADPGMDGGTTRTGEWGFWTRVVAHRHSLCARQMHPFICASTKWDSEDISWEISGSTVLAQAMWEGGGEEGPEASRPEGCVYITLKAVIGVLRYNRNLPSSKRFKAPRVRFLLPRFQFHSTKAR
jgi:hypothetical protein